MASDHNRRDARAIPAISRGVTRPADPRRSPAGSAAPAAEAGRGSIQEPAR